MKKYITTDKHPELKEGCLIQYLTHDNAWYTVSGFFCYEGEQLNYAVKNGYIKELQEKEFTKDDMEKAFEAGRRMEESPLIYTYGCAEDYLDTLNKDTNEETEHKK